MKNSSKENLFDLKRISKETL